MLSIEDFGIPLANGVALALAGLLIAAFFKLQVAQWRGAQRADEQTDVLDYRLEATELAERHCQRNFQVLAGLCSRNGIEVPTVLYDDPPLPQRPDPRDKPHSHHRKGD